MNRDLQYDPAPLGTTTSRSPTVMATLVPTWTIGDRYLILSTIAVNDTTSTTAVAFDLDGVIVFDYNISPRDPTNDYYSCPMVFPYTVLNGVELLQLYFDSAASFPDPGTTGRDAQLAVFKLGPRDQTNADYLTAGSSTTASTYDQSTTVVTGSTVTIAETGDYLVFACAQVGKDETTANFNIRLSHTSGGVTVGYLDQTMRATSAATKNFPWCGMVRLSLTAGDTLFLEHKRTTAGAVSTTYASIVALNVADLPGLVEAEDLADDSTTSTTYAAKAGLNDCFPTKAYKSLALSSGRIRRGAASVDASVQSVYGGVAFHESRNESVVASGEATHFGIKILDTPTAGQRQVQQQYRSEGGGITAAFLSDSAVALINLENNVTTRIYGGEVYGGEAY